MPQSQEMKASLTPEEFELATGLIEKLPSADFQPEAYTEYRTRVLAMLDEKQKGRKITVAPHVPPCGRVVDIYEALKKEVSRQRNRARKPIAPSAKKA